MRSFFSFVFALAVASFVFAFTCSAVTAEPAADNFDGGDGTARNPYVVSSAAQLDLVRHYPRCHFIQSCDIDLGGYNGLRGERRQDGTLVFRELSPAAPCFNGGNGWIPIGGADRIFAGHYDGGGFCISGLAVRNVRWAGLFDIVAEGAVVENVAISSDACISGKDVSGGVCAVNLGTIRKCSSSASLFSEGEGTSIGGVCGTSSGMIGECSFDGFIKAAKSRNGAVGGVCGTAYSGALTNCSSTGTISFTGRKTDGGGICGVSSCDIGRSFFNGKVHGVGVDVRCGGISGITRGFAVWECRSEGGVSGIADDEIAYLGGICGESDASRIFNCRNSGDVSGKGRNVWAGGVCGMARNKGGALNCINSGNVSGNGKNVSVGGIVGLANKGMAENSANLGRVTGRGISDSCAGGVCGEGNTESVLRACVSFGRVMNSVSIAGYPCLTGGVCGYLNSGSSCRSSFFLCEGVKGIGLVQEAEGSASGLVVSPGGGLALASDGKTPLASALSGVKGKDYVTWVEIDGDGFRVCVPAIPFLDPVGCFIRSDGAGPWRAAQSARA